MSIIKNTGFAFGAFALAASPALAGDVEITIAEIQSAPGDLYLSVQTQDQFMKPVGAYGQIIKTPSAGKQIVTLKNVKPGDYSISLWHDINNDKQFNAAADGQPLDGWSMLNAEKLRAVPTFDEVKFTVPANGTAVSMKMIYRK